MYKMRQFSRLAGCASRLGVVGVGLSGGGGTEAPAAPLAVPTPLAGPAPPALAFAIPPAYTATFSLPPGTGAPDAVPGGGLVGRSRGRARGLTAAKLAAEKCSDPALGSVRLSHRF